MHSIPLSQQHSLPQLQLLQQHSPTPKPLAKLSQLTVVPRVFRCDFPQELAVEALKCKTDDDARQLGIEWSTEQCRQLYKAGVNNIHFYTVSAVDSVREVARRLL